MHRTTTADASVESLQHYREEVGRPMSRHQVTYTKVDILLHLGDRLLHATVRRPGGKGLRPEDTVRIAYDPNNPGNIQFADMPPVAMDRVNALLIGAGAVLVACLGGTVVIAVRLGVQARAVRRSTSFRRT
jgi:hypothetical protein